MTLRELQYLVAIADYEHFGKAAEACHVSQPTLSAQVKKLEEGLNAVLVERTNRKVMLTDIGRDVVARARTMLDDANDIKMLTRGAQDPLSGPLRMGIIPTIAPYLLPYLVPVLRKEAPDLQPYFKEEKTGDILDQLRRGKLDVGLLALPVPDEGLDTEPLFEETFKLAMPKGHPLSKRAMVYESDLKREKLMLLAEGHCLRDQALNVCKKYGASGREDFMATSLETLRHMVGAGMGCTLLPALAVDDNPLIETRAFAKPEPVRTLGLVWRRGFPRREGLKRMADMFRSIEGTLPL